MVFQAVDRVLEKILPFQVSYRTAGKILVRLRRLYWRIFGTSQTLEYEYMSMVGRRFFKAGTPAWKRMDHIDAKALLAAIEERIAYFGTRLDEAGALQPLTTLSHTATFSSSRWRSRQAFGLEM